jgi:hypothetical protein
MDSDAYTDTVCYTRQFEGALSLFESCHHLTTTPHLHVYLPVLRIGITKVAELEVTLVAKAGQISNNIHKMLPCAGARLQAYGS